LPQLEKVAGRPPRILHIIPHDGIGGVETAARTAAEREDLPSRFKLLLIAGKSLATDRARIIESPFSSPLNPLAQLRAVVVAIRERPEVVISSLWRSVPVALMIRLLLPRCRLVYFLHAEKHVHFADAFMSYLALRFADEVWADSDVTLQTRTGQRCPSGRVISFVTERLRAQTGSRPDPLRFVSWSRLAHQKGIDRALHFIAALNQRGLKARFDIWGPDDGELAETTRLAGRARLDLVCQLSGRCSTRSAPDDFGQSCIFLQLSRSEGMAMATVEAMQLGLVPVTTAVGEMKRYVVHGETGIIVDPNHMAPALDKVASLSADEEEYERVRRNAIEFWSRSPLYAEDICRAATNLIEAAESQK
jgi:glycosyltransferase involved in cell wall biosynthesis